MAKSYKAYPEMVIDPKKTYGAAIETSKGTINLDLYADKAPLTVNNFVFLARDGFYDGLNFHRVLANFMIQGGCPDGDGRGGPGYRWDDEKSSLSIAHSKGVISMANAGANTNGSQFFITHVVTDWLDGKHGVFGKVKSDADQAVVDAVRQGDKVIKVTITES